MMVQIKYLEDFLKETAFDEGMVDIEGLQGLAPFGFGEFAIDGLLGEGDGLFVVGDLVE